MPYCTYNDVVTRVGATELAALADYDGDGVADAAAVNRAIADAQGDIDSYLQTKNTVPVAPVPPVLRKHCVTMAIYYLQLGANSVTEDYRKAYDDVVKWLRDVIAGKAELGIEPKPAESSSSGGVRMDGQDRVFGRGEPL